MMNKSNWWRFYQDMRNREGIFFFDRKINFPHFSLLFWVKQLFGKSKLANLGSGTGGTKLIPMFLWKKGFIFEEGCGTIDKIWQKWYEEGKVWYTIIFLKPSVIHRWSVWTAWKKAAVRWADQRQSGHRFGVSGSCSGLSNYHHYAGLRQWRTPKVSAALWCRGYSDSR